MFVQKTSSRCHFIYDNADDHHASPEQQYSVVPKISLHASQVEDRDPNNAFR